MDDSDSRAITVLCMLQFAGAIIGWCALAIVLRFHGYPEEFPLVRWRPLPVFLREYGMWLLFFPVPWTILAIPLARSGRRTITVLVHTVVGVLFAVGTPALYIHAAGDPYARGMLIQVRDPTVGTELTDGTPGRRSSD